MKSALFVVTAATGWTLADGSVHPTGYWGEELAEPHRIFSERGWDITIATPGGVRPTLDAGSVRLPASFPPKKTRAIKQYLEQIAPQLATPMALEDIEESRYDIVFYPGGHGPMEDLAVDPVSGKLLTDRLHSGRPFALLCHAPAAMFAARNEDGSWPFKGYTVTALMNVEERTNPASRKAKWLLESRLKEEGANYVHSRVPLTPFVAVDRNLYTGQNPMSSAKLANRIIDDFEANS